MTRGKLPLTQLQAFEAVARLGSYKEAVNELAGSNASKHVAALERELGCKLIARSPRGTLTREGRLLSRHLTRVFDETAVLLAALRSGKVDADLIVSLLQEPPGKPPGR